MGSPFQSPSNMDTHIPSTEGSGVTSRGGADLGEGSRKESDNLSDIPPLPDTYTVGPGDPGKGGHVNVPNAPHPGGTIHNSK